MTLKPGFTLYTVTFKEVGSADPVNVNMIKVFQNGSPWSTGNKVWMYKMDTEGVYGTSYNYRSGKGGWCQGTKLVEDLTIRNGEAVCINNATGSGNIQLQVSGEVVLTPVSYTIQNGYSLIGNITPVKINANEMKAFCRATGTTDEWVEVSTGNKVWLYKMDTEGVYGTSYNYRSGKGGWCQGTKLTEDLMLEPGESVCINNALTGYEVQLRYASPISK